MALKKLLLHYQTMHKKSSLLFALFLFLGWSIDSGFFGLPIASGTSGFLPSLTISLLVALYVIPSALLYTEAILSLPDGANIVSLCKKYTGPLISICVTILFFYLHIYYITSYFQDLPPFLQSLLPNSLPLSQTTIKLLICSLMILITFLGIQTTSRVNFVFVTALLLTLAWYCLLQISQVSPDLLYRMNWAFVFLAIPTYVGNYYSISLLPTLSTYLQRDLRKIIKVILLGTFLFFCCTTLLQWIIIGTTSESALWIANGGYGKYNQNINLEQTSFTLTYLFHSMIFFSIFTTLLVGVLILIDVCSDALHIPPEKRSGRKRFLLILLILIPPVLFSYSEWILFLDNFTGWGEIFLIGPLPIWLVWNLRYRNKSPASHLLPGGRLSLILYGIVNFILFYLQAVSVIWTTTA